MKARITKKGVTVSEIFNEGLKDLVDTYVEGTGCKVIYENYMTKAKITGSDIAVNKFIANWNK